LVQLFFFFAPPPPPPPKKKKQFIFLKMKKKIFFIQKTEADQEFTALRTQLNTNEQRLSDVEHVIERITQDISGAATEQKRLQEKLEDLVSFFKIYLQSSRFYKNTFFFLFSQRKQVENANESVQASRGRQGELQDELKSVFTNQLTPAEQQQLQQTRKDIDELTETITNVAQQRGNLELRRDNLNHELNIRINPSLNELRTKLSDIDLASVDAQLKDAQQQQKVLATKLANLSRSIEGKETVFFKNLYLH